MARPILKSALTVLALLATVVAASADGDTPAQSKKARTERRGGYSYTAAQTINTSGDSRGKYGAAESLRDPNVDRQTNFGPFDHGFFYDNGAGPGQHGGNSPYLH